MKTTLKLFISSAVIFTALIFAMIFANSVSAAQNPSYPSPSQCNGADWNIGLPNGITCSSSVTTGGSGIAMENDSRAVSVFGSPSRLKPDLTSLNKFCQQYTGDSMSYATYGRMHNYCTACDQNLSWWSGSSWVTNAVCAGTLNVQQVTCATGCGPTCTTHSTKQCSGNAVYWYNSCGAKEDLFQACASNQVCQNAQCVNVACSTNSNCGSNGYVGSPFCQGNNVYKNYKTYTCNNPGTANSSCSQSIVPQLITNCTANQTCTSGSCTNINIVCSNNSNCGNNRFTGSPFCQGNNVYQNYITYTCNNAGTANSYCSNSTSAQLKNTCTGNQTCTNGSCTSQNIVCSSNTECGTNNYIGSPFCQNGDVYKYYRTYTCNNPGTAQSSCSQSDTAQLQTNCTANQTCTNGQCQNVNIACSSNSDCGTNSYTGSPFCQGNNVYQNYITYTCNNAGTANSYCSNSTSAQLKNTCTGNQTCSNGSCSQNCSYHSYQQCSGNSIYWYDSCGNQQDLAQYCQNGCYNNSCQNYNNATVQTNSATNVYSNQATLNGYLYNYNNYNNSAYVWFQWGTSTSYGYETQRQAMSYNGAFSQNITNVYSGTTYHFRAVAQPYNGNTVYGQDIAFTVAGSTGNLLTINKTVRNMTSGNSSWSNTAYASPSDTLMFMITIQATGNQNVNNVVARDTFPTNLIYRNQLVVSGSSNYSGDITSGINLGTISAGQTATITYQAQVASLQNFSYGTTVLNNNVSVTSSNSSSNPASNASISVTRSAVYGASTISTGLTNNFLLDSFVLPLIIALIGLWMFKAGMFVRVEKWVDNQKRNSRGYKASKELNSRIAKIRKVERT